MRRILLLKDMFGDSKGSIIDIEHETDKELYYTDGFDRWVYVNKSEEGELFMYYGDDTWKT